MTASLSGADVEYRPRRRDRRETFGELLASLTRTLDSRGDLALMRGAFEESLRRLVPVHSVQLRESTSRWIARPDGDGGAESIALDVPGADASSQGILEARFDPGCRLGEWDFQMLGVAAHVGALVLEIERGRSRLARAGLSGSKPRRDGAAPLIGSTPAMQALRSKIERVAGTDFTVLLEGESGVGKELVARQIHELSRRRHGPFVAINCAALVETLLEAELFGIEERTATGVKGRRGKFEHADGGTLFLDEVSDLSVSAQAKLLRAIQDLAVERVGGTGHPPARHPDCRRHQPQSAGAGRAAAVSSRPLLPVERRRRQCVPALRERRADILELARYFLERHRVTRPLGLSTAAADALVAYDWPGNVRELERLIERSVALAATDVIQLDDLPPVVRGDYSVALMPSIDRRETLRAWGGRYVRLVLERCQGNKREACRVLDISYHTLQAYLRQLPPVEAVDAGAGWEPGGPESAETREREVSACATTVEA